MKFFAGKCFMLPVTKNTSSLCFEQDFVIFIRKCLFCFYRYYFPCENCIYNFYCYTEVAHVHPKATAQSPYMEPPQGTLEKKECFWLNNNYIQKIVDNRPVFRPDRGISHIDFSDGE